jgi:ABC-type phosphate transport system ATPase subunit
MSNIKTEHTVHRFDDELNQIANLVEFGETGKIFTNPEDPRTESYITGRIG